MTRDEMKPLLEAALKRLKIALETLEETIERSSPAMRPRKFLIAPGVVWPHDNLQKLRIGVLEYWLSDYKKIAWIISDDFGHRPRLILRAIRMIDAAAAWCEARRRGLERAAQEIMRQQAKTKAVEALETMTAMNAIAKLRGKRR